LQLILTLLHEVQLTHISNTLIGVTITGFKGWNLTPCFQKFGFQSQKSLKQSAGKIWGSGGIECENGWIDNAM
jgi:hypothetical protein